MFKNKIKTFNLVLILHLLINLGALKLNKRRFKTMILILVLAISNNNFLNKISSQELSIKLMTG